jgi:GT2 family glycosyltransferase
MLFSVIIPTCGRNGLLEKCLDALSPRVQLLPEESYEVIVTDDGSNGTARGLVAERYQWARWVEGPRRGPAANRNNGAAHAAGEWLAFVDDDCIPDAGWLRAYMAAREADPAMTVFEGRTYADRPRRSLAEIAPVNEAGGYLWSCNMAIDRTVFAGLNGFDERFPFPVMEDVDFRHRLRLANVKSKFIHNAAVCHPWRIQPPTAEARYEKALAIYLEKYKERVPDFTFRSQFVAILRGTLRETLPGIIQFRGAGAGAALLRTYHQLRHALRAFKRYGF